MAPDWSDEEVAIAIYFLSRLIYPKTVRCLLLRRGFDRSVVAIENKLVFIAQRHPELRSAGGYWDLNAVDLWIDNLIGDHESVNHLIRFSPTDAEDVLAVCISLGRFSPELCSQSYVQK